MIVRFLFWVPEVLVVSLVVVLLSCIHNHGMGCYVQDTSERILNYGLCTKRFKTKSMRHPVGFSSKSFLDLCEPRKVNPRHWKICLSQRWCQRVLFLWQAGLALELPKQRADRQESCPAGNCTGGGNWASQSWLFLQSTVVVWGFLPLRFCSFTVSPVNGNFKLLLTSRGLFLWR